MCVAPTANRFTFHKNKTTWRLIPSSLPPQNVQARYGETRFGEGLDRAEEERPVRHGLIASPSAIATAPLSPTKTIATAARPLLSCLIHNE